jgi:peptide/nickel transport system permease protein
MQRFLARRFVFAIVSVFGATLIVFCASRLTGDPRLIYGSHSGYGMTPEQWEALGKKLGLDKPLVVQYFMWVNQLLHGDLGKRFLDERPIIELLPSRLGASLQLALAASLYAFIVGIPAGVLAAVKRGTFWDYLARGYALTGIGVPHFWIGLMGILLFGQRLGWLPTGTSGSTEDFPLSWSHIKYFIMPALVAGWHPAAEWMRLSRSSMLEILDSEYIKFARSKGVRESAVIWKHAFKNALIPPLTAMAMSLAGFIGRMVIVETVFAWPGMGRMAVEAIFTTDFPRLQAAVLVFSLFFIAGNFLADIAYAYIDPRIRYT